MRGETDKSGEPAAVPCTRIVDRAAWAGVALLLLLLFVAFGNTHEPETYGNSLLTWLIGQWRNAKNEFGHGVFIPFVSAYFVWRDRRAVAQAVDAGALDWRALFALSGALVIYWAGVRAQQPRLSLLAYIALLWTLSWFLYGTRLMRRLTVPCAYLVFAIPMGFLTAATLPLRLLATRLSVFLLQGAGVGVVRQGTAILSSGPKPFALDVAEACSGLRSLIPLCALIAAYAYLAQKENWRRWALFLCAPPIAIVANVVRVIFLVLVALWCGSGETLRMAHDFSGYVVFAVAVLLMVGVSKQLGKKRGRHATEN